MKAEFKMVGRLAMTPKGSVNGQPNGITKYMMGGVFFSQNCPFSDTKDWDMLECEIVVKVKKAHKPTRFHKGDLETMVISLGQDSHWTGFGNNEEEDGEDA